MGVAMGCQGNSRWRQHSPMSLHSLDATTIVCMNVCLCVFVGGGGSGMVGRVLVHSPRALRKWYE